MRIILKWEVPRPVDGVSTIKMPVGSIVRHLDYDGTGSLCVWTESSAETTEFEDRFFKVVPTGGKFHDTDCDYVGTVVVKNIHAMVWHLYEVS